MEYTPNDFKTKSVLYHDFIKTAKTDLHHIKPVFDLRALENAGSTAIKNLGHSGLLTAASIPISVQSLEFVIACIKHYNLATREIHSVDGRVICNLKPDTIEKCFSIPPWPESVTISKGECGRIWHMHKEKYSKNIAQKWMKEKHNSAKSHFYDVSKVRESS